MRIGVAIAIAFGLGLGLAAAGLGCSKRRANTGATLAGAVGDAERIAAGDLDGDRRPELVMADARTLRVTDASGREIARLSGAGGIQVLRVADIDGDGHAEILAGWGRSREHPDARARVSVYRLDRASLVEEIVARPSTSRNDVVAILPLPGSSPPALLVAHFESKYMVRSSWARRREGRWELEPVAAIRMATSYAIGDVDGDGELDLVVGRVYGDDAGVDGDAFVLRSDGSRVPIPTSGGVRSLTVSDLDGDGRLELLIGDGWNKNYGQLARARLTRAWWSGGQFRTELLEQSSGQYTLWSIAVADVDGDGQRDIVTRGSAHVRVLSRRGDRWKGTTVASGCRDVALVKLDAAPGHRVLAACDGGARLWPGPK